MRIATLTVLTLTAGAILAGSSLTASAQPAPPPASSGDSTRAAPGPTMHGPMAPGAMQGGAMQGPMMQGPMHGMRGRMIDPGVFGLLHSPEDRKLTAPEVQKIAEAALLWFGNRGWKVTEVAPGTDNTIKFAFATAEGSVIARFTMDTRSGRVVRVG